jgi:hypothetical protein
MKNKTEHRELFGPGGCITKDAIQLYIDKELTDSELKKIKQHAKKCSLCAESLEGAHYFSSGNSYSKRVDAMFQSNFRRSLNNDGKSRKLLYAITSAAASVALLLGIYYIIQLKEVVVEKSEIAGNAENIGNQASVEELSDSVAIVARDSETEAKLWSNDRTQLKESNVVNEEEPILIAEDIEVKEPEVIIGDPEIVFDDSEAEYEYRKAYIEMEERNELEGDVPDIAGHKIEQNPSTEYLPDDNFVLSKAKAEKSDRKGYIPTLRSAKKSERSFNKSTYYVAEVMPMFQGGGLDRFNEYITDSLKVMLSDSVFRQSIVVGFRIDTMGNVDKVQLISGTDSDILNKQVIRIIKNSPKWIPASISGKPVESDQEVEVVFGK